MRLPITRSTVIYCALILICALAFTFFIKGLLRALPDSITYHAQESTAAVSGTDAAATHAGCLFDNPSDITADGPFVLRLDGDGIYVFSGEERLCRINTKTEHFPEADRKAIISGISASTREKLFELIEYMES